MKTITIKTSISGIADAISDLQALGEECREIVDNAPDGLNQTQRIQTFEQTADALEGISEPDIPEGLDDVEFDVQQLDGGKKGLGRAKRCQNAVAILEAARDTAQDKADAARAEEDEQAALATDDDRSEEEKAEAENNASAAGDKADEIEQFISELEDIISECESLEFPGMFG